MSARDELDERISDYGFRCADYRDVMEAVDDYAAEVRRDALREAALSLEWFADDPNRDSRDTSALSEGVEYLRALADKETP